MSSRSKPLAISEQFIRQLWKNQRFTSSNLKTVDGKGFREDRHTRYAEETGVVQ